MHYRREVDGLRAIAVLPVILFHAGFGLFSGGFVGVDVFFVISGYLITSIILTEMREGKFTIIAFYERRARRILPALFVVMLACVPFAWLWMLPGELRDFSRSLVAVSVFASNVLFWRESGYFDTATELKPLLHTWSLALEEQYYLLFPIFLLLTWRLGKRWILGILVALAFISFAAAMWSAPDNPGAAFYLLPTRFWELLVGAFIAFYYFNNNVNEAGMGKAGPLVDQSVSIIGILLIAYAVFAFDKNTPFPSQYTLIPTLGAALLILFATPRTLVGKLLSSKLLVGVGLISYSAYLWHQPLFAFARIRSFDGPSSAVFLLLSLLSLSLAYCSWRFVEKPFRDRRRVSRGPVFGAALLVTTAFAGFGFLGHFKKGFPDRFGVGEQELLASADKRYRETMVVFGLRKCFIDVDQNHETLFSENCITTDTRTTKVVVFGDSHAAHLVEGVKRFFSNPRYAVEQWTAAGCRAIDFPKNSRRCKDFYRSFIQDVLPALPEKSLIVISSYWFNAFNRIGEAGFIGSLKDLFATLRKHGHVVLVVGQTPAFAQNPVGYFIRTHTEVSGLVFLRSRNFIPANRVLEDETRKSGFFYANPGSVLCEKLDPLMCLVSDQNKFVYFDANHLSLEGSGLWIKNMLLSLKFSIE